MTKLARCLNIFIRIYVVITLGFLVLYVYQKYFLAFDDMVLYTPVVFLKSEYSNTDTIEFYSFLGTSHDNTPIQINDGLFCLNSDFLWEREIQPANKNFILNVDKTRNALITDINNNIGDAEPDSAASVRTVREHGKTLAEKDGFAITYDISSLNTPLPTTCRLKIYYATKTPFFNLVKSTNFFSHKITITH